jgi:hypothetical protein
MQNRTVHPKQMKGAGTRKTIILMLCLGISLFGWLRFSGAMSIYSLLLELGIRPHPIYYLLSGLIIGLSFLVAFFSSTLNRKWACAYVRICSAMTSIHLLYEIFFIRGRVNITQVMFIFSAAALIFLLTSRNQNNESTSS